MAIRILTDTSSDYSFERCKELGISMVSMTVNVGETSYTVGKDLSRDDFYRMLLHEEPVPKTSQPSPQAFLDHYERAMKAGDDVIAITISSSISGTYQSALTAKEICGYDRIYVVDSRCATVGIQFLVEEALRMAQRGDTPDAIVGRLNELKSRIHIYAGVETLKYLYLGGRLSRAEAGIGTLAGIRPLLSLHNGKLEAYAKCMGTKKAMRRLVETIQSVEKDPAFDTRFIYTYDSANCEALMSQLPELFCSDPIEIGPSISVHSGPGVYGAVFVAAN